MWQVSGSRSGDIKELEEYSMRMESLFDRRGLIPKALTSTFFLCLCLTMAYMAPDKASGSENAKRRCVDQGGTVIPIIMTMNMDYCRKSRACLEKNRKKLLAYAEQGHYDAQCYLGILAFAGPDYFRDYGEALKWFRKAAECEVKLAHTFLGRMYLHGLGVEKNYTVALDWLNKAANAGEEDAMYELGVIYRDGSGVQQDRKEAGKWFYKAAIKGHKLAKKELEKVGIKIQSGGK